jgi:hypothetical protein
MDQEWMVLASMVLASMDREWMDHVLTGRK